MRARLFIAGVALLLAAAPTAVWASSNDGDSAARAFMGRGVVQQIDLESQRIVIQHEAITNYMAAMTMPFNVKEGSDLAGLEQGDEISFVLHVTDTKSWVDHIHNEGHGRSELPQTGKAAASDTSRVPALMDCQLTNELGHAIRLDKFRGQALAITFFYTRCPVPDFCPRLSKNFQEASAQLAAMTNGPGNWHFFSVTFDPQSDTPETLKAYAERYQYDPARWSFLTGAPSQVGALARAVGVKYKEDSGTIDHNFRTLIIDATGRIQMIFPTGGNLTGQIVEQMLKASTATNQSLAQNQK